MRLPRSPVAISLASLLTLAQIFYEGPPNAAYGQVQVADGSTAQGSVGITAQKLTAFVANGPANKTTPDHTDDSITVLTAGAFLVGFDSSFSGSANAVMELHLRVNDIETHAGIHRKLIGGDVGSGSATDIAILSVGDCVTVWVESANVADTDTITIVDATLFVLEAP